MQEKPLIYPQVLVAKHKHSTDYYAVTTNLDILRAKWQMIRTWFEYDMFYEPDAPRIDNKDREILEMTSAEVDALPDVFKEKAIRTRRRAQLAQREYDRAMADNELVRHLVRAQSFEEAVAMSGPGSNTSAINYIISIYGGQEYTEWDLEALSPLE